MSLNLVVPTGENLRTDWFYRLSDSIEPLETLLMPNLFKLMQYQCQYRLGEEARSNAKAIKTGSNVCMSHKNGYFLIINHVNFLINPLSFLLAKCSDFDIRTDEPGASKEKQICCHEERIIDPCSAFKDDGYRQANETSKVQSY